MSKSTVIVHSSFEETQSLATTIADDCSRAEIESHSILVHHDGSTWFDIAVTDVFTEEHLHRAVLYLQGRGLLLKHPKNSSWVHLIEAEFDLAPAQHRPQSSSDDLYITDRQAYLVPSSPDQVDLQTAAR